MRCLCIALKQRAILQLKAACLSLAGSNIQACCGVWVGSGNGAIGLENYTHACSARVYVRLKPMGKCPDNLMILADPGLIRKPSAGGLPRRNSGLRVSWTPGTSFLSQSVLWLCGARETRNQLCPTLRRGKNSPRSENGARTVKVIFVLLKIAPPCRNTAIFNGS